MVVAFGLPLSNAGNSSAFRRIVEACEAIALDKPLLDASDFTSTFAFALEVSSIFGVLVGVDGSDTLASGVATTGMLRGRDGVNGGAVGAIREIGLGTGSSSRGGSSGWAWE